MRWHIWMRWRCCLHDVKTTTWTWMSPRPRAMVVDFRKGKQRFHQKPVRFYRTLVERVSRYRCLGVHISEDLSWTTPWWRRPTISVAALWKASPLLHGQAWEAEKLTSLAPYRPWTLKFTTLKHPKRTSSYALHSTALYLHTVLVLYIIYALFSFAIFVCQLQIVHTCRLFLTYSLFTFVLFWLYIS